MKLPFQLSVQTKQSIVAKNLFREKNSVSARATFGICILLAGLAIVLTGCTSGGGPPGSARYDFAPVQWPGELGALSNERTGCGVLDGTALPLSTLTFGLTETVKPQHAPVPHNQSERVVFAQLYETLVNVACDGTVTPGLAELWTCTNDSTTWVFTLRDDARFWDGTRITADHVRLAWSENQSRNQPGNQQSGPANIASPWTWIDARAGSITTVDARRLAIQLPEPQANFPLLLAHPAAAVSIRQQGWTWPLGSGPARLRASDPTPRPDLLLLPNIQHPAAAKWKSLTFTVIPDLDQRDFVTADIDLALTRDLATVSFFNAAPGFSTTPLPWNQLVLLVCPPEMNPAGTASWAHAIAQLNVGQDVATVSMRSWDHLLFPVGGSQYCPQLSGPIPSQSKVPLHSDLGKTRLDAQTIAFATNDAGGAELAARLSHFMGAQTRAAGLSAADLKLALQWQMSGAIIIMQDQLFPSGCLQMAALMGRAAWLQEAGMSRPEATPAENLVQANFVDGQHQRAPAAEFAASGTVQAIALSRGWLITRGQLAGLQLSYDGTPLLSGLGPAATPTVAP